MMDRRTQEAIERAAAEQAAIDRAMQEAIDRAAAEQAVVNRAVAEIERQTEITSRQPRFTGGSKGFISFLRWVQRDEIGRAPDYAAESRKRDAWLRAVWRQEPHLAGVVNSVTLIDANRGWTLAGGRNQVMRYTSILHDAEAGEGWRTYLRKASLSYWCTDLGSITEVGRDGAEGPLRALFHVDSARCRLTGDVKAPLEYYPSSGVMQSWGPLDYFRVASMPSDDEALHSLGFCAVSRCIEVVRLLYAVMMHDQEQVGARAPKGLLLLQGISEQQWVDSLAMRDEQLDSLERRYYGGVQVLASAGIDQVDAKLIALSQLPPNFNAKEFQDLSMYAVALCFGYDPSEFWPVQFGSIGRGTEAEMQHEKATGKGGLDFALHFQERLQGELPETVQFEFEQRDDAGELTTTILAKAKLEVVTSAYEAGLMQGAPLLSREEARTLLAEERLIPEEWTLAEEEIEVTDTEDTGRMRRRRERLLDAIPVRRAMERYPREEIVAYDWPVARLRTLWVPRLTPRYHARAVYRQDDSEVLYQSGDVTITEADVDKAIAEARRRVGPEFAELLEAPTLTAEQLAAFGG